MVLCQKFTSFFLAAVIAAPLGAQTEPCTIMSMLFVEIKPDQQNEWQVALRDRAAILKKAGARHDYTIWTAATGGQDILRVDLFAKWAELDSNPYRDLKTEAAELARIEDRLDKTALRSKRVLAKIVLGANLPLPSQPPPMIDVNTVHILPGNAAEYAALVKSELQPLMRKAEFKLFFIAQTVYGGTVPEYTLVAGRTNWAGLDADSSWTSTPEYEHFRGKLNAILAGREANLYRFRPDLSYLSAQNGSR